MTGVRRITHDVVAVNAAQSAIDPWVATGGLITARQLLACQARMSEALLALGARGGLFTDPGTASGEIRAVQIMEVQGAIE